MDEIKIERICKPGDVNVNGIKYSRDSYDRALEFFNKENLLHPMEIDMYLKDKYLNGNIGVMCGKILEVYDDYIVVKPYPEFVEILTSKEYNPRAYMRYIGELEDDVACVQSIITFDILIDHFLTDKQQEEIFL